MSERVTGAQREILSKLAADPDGGLFADEFSDDQERALIELFERGYITSDGVRFSDYFSITPAGRSAIGEE